MLEAFGRCEAARILNSMSTTSPNSTSTTSPNSSSKAHAPSTRTGFSYTLHLHPLPTPGGGGPNAVAATVARGGLGVGRVRVGYMTAIDGCRVHNSMLRALFDSAVVGHQRSTAFTFVWTTHLIERRPGFSAPQACVKASSKAVEVGPGMTGFVYMFEIIHSYLCIR